MKVKVLNVVIDFSDSDGDVSKEDQDEIKNSIIDKVFEVDEEDDIADEISNITGWCVSSVSFETVEE